MTGKMSSEFWGLGMANYLKIQLKPGDIFLTENPMALGKIIDFVQSWTSRDGKAQYSHAGLIKDFYGNTYEALWHVTSQSFFGSYNGSKVLVFRHKDMTPPMAESMLKFLHDEHDNDFYPILKLPLMASSILPKFITSNLVCSELVAKGLFHIGLFPYFAGCTPDDLHDWYTMLSRYGVIQKVFDGIIPP